jgi:hypothetical protein
MSGRLDSTAQLRPRRIPCDGAAEDGLQFIDFVVAQ